MIKLAYLAIFPSRIMYTYAVYPLNSPGHLKDIHIQQGDKLR